MAAVTSTPTEVPRTCDDFPFYMTVPHFNAAHCRIPDRFQDRQHPCCPRLCRLCSVRRLLKCPCPKFWPYLRRSLINSNKLSAKLYETAVGVASSMSPLSLDFHEAKHIGIWRKLWCRYSRTHKDQAFVRICWWSCRCNVGWGHHMRCSSSDMCTVVSTERQPPSPVCQVHGCIIGCLIDDLPQILLRLLQRNWSL